jgi:hypothetical protein
MENPLFLDGFPIVKPWGFPQKMDQLQAPSDVDASSKLMEKRLKPTDEFGKFGEVNHLEKMHLKIVLQDMSGRFCVQQLIKHAIIR